MKKNKDKKLPIERIKAAPDAGLSAEAVEERINKGYVNQATDPYEKSNIKIVA